MERHFTVTGFVIDGDRTLLHWHRKTQMWLPPGGHIDPDEDPVQAVLREVAEECGIAAEVVSHIAAMRFGVPQQIAPPYAILVEDIPEGPHQHIDMIYFVRAVAGTVRAAGSDDFVWVTAQQLRDNEPLDVGDCGSAVCVPEDVRLLALRGMELLRSPEVGG
jgi:8-oxo-dGTP pyrophosphatase MutT (NUDIX family)